MKFVEAVELDPNPALSTIPVVVAGDAGHGAGADSEIVLPWSNTAPDGTDLGTEGSLLMALVYFPTSRCFVKSWADDHLAKVAFPMRAGMIEDGFEHVWIRCAAAG